MPIGGLVYDGRVQWWQQPFFLVALPIIITFVLATWYQGSRITDLREGLGKRIDDLRSDIGSHLAGIEKRLERLEVEVEALQEGSWR
jgi:hypothetical protein